MTRRATYCAHITALVTLVTSAAIAQASVAPSYRVAGTVAITADRAVALIESSDGSQQLYRLGDQLDGWQITGIDLEQVTLARGADIIHMPLEGKLMQLEATVAELPELPAQSATSMTIDFDRAFERLVVLEQKPAGGDGDITYADINRALGLSAATQIRAVERSRAPTPREVVYLTMTALANELAFKLAVAENRFDEIYLVPGGKPVSTAEVQ